VAQASSAPGSLSQKQAPTVYRRAPEFYQPSTNGGRLDGSIPGVPVIAVGGIFTYSVDDEYNGLMTGSDTVSFAGQYAPRADQGTYKMGSNCRGVGFYTDSLGNKINYVMTAVDEGDTLYFQGSDPGVAVSGAARRIR
jgi:hypothetical protein